MTSRNVVGCQSADLTFRKCTGNLTCLLLRPLSRIFASESHETLPFAQSEPLLRTFVPIFLLDYPFLSKFLICLLYLTA